MHDLESPGRILGILRVLYPFWWPPTRWSKGHGLNHMDMDHCFFLVWGICFQFFLGGIFLGEDLCPKKNGMVKHFGTANDEYCIVVDGFSSTKFGEKPGFQSFGEPPKYYKKRRYTTMKCQKPSRSSQMIVHEMCEISRNISSSSEILSYYRLMSPTLLGKNTSQNPPLTSNDKKHIANIWVE